MFSEERDEIRGCGAAAFTTKLFGRGPSATQGTQVGNEARTLQCEVCVHFRAGPRNDWRGWLSISKRLTRIVRSASRSRGASGSNVEKPLGMRRRTRAAFNFVSFHRDLAVSTHSPSAQSRFRSARSAFPTPDLDPRTTAGVHQNPRFTPSVIATLLVVFPFTSNDVASLKSNFPR